MIDAVAVVVVVAVVEQGVDAPVAVAVEWDDESYSLPEVRIMTFLQASGLEGGRWLLFLVLAFQKKKKIEK